MKPRAAAIIVNNGRVLLVHRIKDGREYWVLPGGSIESGESEATACLREVKEETGLGIRILGQVRSLTNEGRMETYFLAVPTGGELELGEPERSRHSPSNQYVLEWVGPRAFAGLNFQPQQLRTTIAEQLAPGDA